MIMYELQTIFFLKFISHFRSTFSFLPNNSTGQLNKVAWEAKRKYEINVKYRRYNFISKKAFLMLIIKTNKINNKYYFILDDISRFVLK